MSSTARGWRAGGAVSLHIDAPAGAILSHTRMPLPPFKLLYTWLLPQHKDMRPAMQYTLEAVKQAVETKRTA